MKKIFNIVLALAVVGIFASCKAQESYYTTPKANDFEFGDPVVIKAIIKPEISNNAERDLYTKDAEGNYSSMSDYAYFDRTVYRTYIPIEVDTTNGGYFDYEVIQSPKRNVTVEWANDSESGLMVYWEYEDKSENVAATGALKDKNGKPVYYLDEDSGNFKEAKWTSSYKAPIVSSVKITVTGTDCNDGTNQVTKDITVNYSTSSTKEIVEYQRWY